MTARFILAQHFVDLHLEDIVVVAPDVGRAKLAQKFAEKVGADLAVLTKDASGAAGRRDRLCDRPRRRHRRRSSSTTSSTPAGTLCAAAETLLEQGARSVYAAATPRRLLRQRLREHRQHAVRAVVVTDTIPPAPGAPDNVFVLPCAELLTDSIRRIFTDGSVSEVFGGENQLF